MTDIEGENPIETAAEVFCSAGEMLFGRSWKSALANALGVSPRTMKRWATGEVEIEFDHGAFRDLRNFIKLEVDALQVKRQKMISFEEQLTDGIFGTDKFAFKP